MKRATILAGAAVIALTACGEPAETRPAAQTVPSTDEAATAAVGRPSEIRTFRDWTAVCDNGDACVAYGPAADGATGWVRIGLDPGTDARPDVRVGFWPDGPEPLAGPGVVILDGRRLRAAAPGDGSDGLIVEGGLQAARAVGQGRALSVTAAGQTVTMNLNGAAAALLWIDERQGRLETPTALIRIGTRPAGTVPAPIPLPRVVAAPAVDQGDYGRSTADENSVGMALPPTLAALPAIAQCRENLSFRPGMMEEGVQAARLSGGKELWMIPCDAGAYNLFTIQFLTDAGGADPQPLTLPGSQPATGEGDSDLQLVNAGYDPKTRQISAFAKARGIGDCGVSATWTWSGRAFVLTGESVMGDCNGMPPALWPTTYRTRD